MTEQDVAAVPGGNTCVDLDLGDVQKGTDIVKDGLACLPGERLRQLELRQTQSG